MDAGDVIKNFNEMTMRRREPEEERRREPHYVIVSPKRRKIWKGTFPTAELAIEEYRAQMDKLTPEIREEQDWIIERHGIGEVVRVHVPTAAADGDDGFGGF